MMKLWLRIKLIYFLIRVSRNPNDTNAALAMGPCLFRLGHIQQTRKQISLNSQDIPFLKAHRLLKKIDLQALNTCPEGSLGKIFATHMLSNNLDPEFYGTITVTNDESYIMMRLRQTHDLWHVFAGLSTSVQDELALQAFMFAQTGAPLAPLLMGGALFRLGLTNDPRMYEAFERIQYGWNLGKRTKSIFALDWEANWNTPLHDLRAQYGLIETLPVLRNQNTEQLL